MVMSHLIGNALILEKFSTLLKLKTYTTNTDSTIYAQDAHIITTVITSISLFSLYSIFNATLFKYPRKICLFYTSLCNTSTVEDKTTVAQYNYYYHSEPEFVLLMYYVFELF